MQKYAFIENVPGLSVDNYKGFLDDGEWLSQVIGLDGIDACMACAKDLIADGYCMLNFCGDFNEEHVAELMKDAPEGTDIHYAAYLPEEQAKLEALTKYDEYGLIIFGGVEEPYPIELLAPEMNTHARFIRDVEQAVQVAQDLCKAGVDGIELCGSFDPDMTQQIIAAVEEIDPRIPVGSNGLG